VQIGSFAATTAQQSALTLTNANEVDRHRARRRRGGHPGRESLPCEETDGCCRRAIALRAVEQVDAATVTATPPLHGQLRAPEPFQTVFFWCGDRT